jgi:hypothetical protein
VHIDDFLCSGRPEDLEWLSNALRRKYDLKKKMIGEGHAREGKYLNRIIKWTKGGVQMEGDPKHAEILLEEWGMKQCTVVDTPVTKDGADKIGVGDELPEDEAKRARRAIARINYMAQDRPDLSVAARLLSQHMAVPREGVVPGIKRVIRYIQKYPRGVSYIGKHYDTPILHVWTDSDWAGDLESRRSCSGGSLQLDTATVHHWSKLQTNVALPSGEAELNAAAKGISEGIGVYESMKEMFRVSPRIVLHIDASACEGILLRQGAGRVKHLTTKQLWVQGAVKTYGIDVDKVPRRINSSDILTHPVSSAELTQGLNSMWFNRVPRAPAEHLAVRRSQLATSHGHPKGCLAEGGC